MYGYITGNTLHRLDEQLCGLSFNDVTCCLYCRFIAFFVSPVFCEREDIKLNLQKKINQDEKGIMVSWAKKRRIYARNRVNIVRQTPVRPG